MKQQMIMNTKWGAFEDRIKNWCEAGWTVVLGSQGMHSMSGYSQMFWVWMQEPAPETTDIDLDIHP